MKIYEYQAKNLFSQHEIPVPLGKTIDNPQQLDSIFSEFNSPGIVLKAQVYTGGRGKAGGVKLTDDLDQAKILAREILDMNLKGLPVKTVLVEQQIDIKSEFYLSFIQDRDNSCFKLIFSPQGGMDIEELARVNPDKIWMKAIKYFPGLQSYQIREILTQLPEISLSAKKSLYTAINKLYNLFIATESSLVEINPLVITGEDKCLACDAKVVIDDNALFRHPQLASLRIPEQEDPFEREAKEKKLNYVKLDGNVGCMVNGAGLAMTTMDVIKHYQGQPANFLDIGGGAKSQQVYDALSIIVKDPAVKVIFINIFGGIVRCDQVAEGIIQAKNKLNINHPMVIRLIGTNDQLAYKLLKNENLQVFTEMSEAAKQAVKYLEESPK
ncbi:MAG: ADP-forming succinate--CoA ligase subunit beta [bacterium]